jgi:hypothetical protein
MVDKGEMAGFQYAVKMLHNFEEGQKLSIVSAVFLLGWIKFFKKAGVARHPSQDPSYYYLPTYVLIFLLISFPLAYLPITLFSAICATCQSISSSVT